MKAAAIWWLTQLSFRTWWPLLDVSLVHLLQQRLHAADILLCRSHRPVSDALCFCFYTAEEALHIEHTVFVLQAALVFLGPLSACVSAHSTPSRSPTHSSSSVFNCFVFFFLFFLSQAFRCLLTHQPATCYTTPVQACVLTFLLAGLCNTVWLGTCQTWCRVGIFATFVRRIFSNKLWGECVRAPCYPVTPAAASSRGCRAAESDPWSDLIQKTFDSCTQALNNKFAC